MAQLGGNFDATGVKPKEAFDIMPPGDYPVMIVASEMKATKDGTGQYLYLELDVIDGEMKGRKVWDRLNLVNKNPKAVEIAERTLSAICHAVGVLNVSDSEQLHGRAMVASVKVKPAQGEFPAGNEVSTYKPLANAAPAPVYQPPASTVAPTPVTSATGSAPPWRKAS